jgi:hypothetical protein
MERVKEGDEVRREVRWRESGELRQNRKKTLFMIFLSFFSLFFF